MPRLQCVWRAIGNDHLRRVFGAPSRRGSEQEEARGAGRRVVALGIGHFHADKSRLERHVRRDCTIPIMQSTGFRRDEINLEELRERLKKMTGAELRKFGRHAAYMCSPKTNTGQKPRQVFEIQLEEARNEWKRRTVTKKRVVEEFEGK